MIAYGRFAVGLLDFTASLALQLTRRSIAVFSDAVTNDAGRHAPLSRVGQIHFAMQLKKIEQKKEEVILPRLLPDLYLVPNPGMESQPF